MLHIHRSHSHQGQRRQNLTLPTWTHTSARGTTSLRRTLILTHSQIRTHQYVSAGGHAHSNIDTATHLFRTRNHITSKLHPYLLRLQTPDPGTIYYTYRYRTIPYSHHTHTAAAFCLPPHHLISCRLLSSYLIHPVRIRVSLHLTSPFLCARGA